MKHLGFAWEVARSVLQLYGGYCLGKVLMVKRYKWKIKRMFKGVAAASIAANEAAQRADTHESCRDTTPVDDDIDVIVVGIDGKTIPYHYDRPWCLYQELVDDYRVVHAYPAQRVSAIDVPDTIEGLDGD